MAPVVCEKKYVTLAYLDCCLDFSLCTLLNHPYYTPKYDFIKFPHQLKLWYFAPIVCEILQYTVSQQLILYKFWIKWIGHFIYLSNI